MTFTKEQLIARINQVTAINKFRISRDPEADGLAMDNELLAIALASLTAEPAPLRESLQHQASGNRPAVWVRVGDNNHAHDCTLDYDEAREWESRGLEVLRMVAPPAPVVPDVVGKLFAILDRHTVQLGWGERPVTLAELIIARDGSDELEACRAAMLKDSQPVSNRDELPLDYLQGHKDGLEWVAQLAEASHPQTSDWLYDDPVELAKAIRKGPDMPEADGNSPVIPDGYALVPIDATRAMIDAAARVEEDGYDAMHKAMIAAAPQQEVK